jgi:hypothetical protein
MWRIGDHGIGDYLDSTSSTLGDLLSATTEHSRLLHDGLTLSLDIGDETATLKCEFDEDVVPHRWYPEFTLGKIVAELRRAFAPQMITGPIAVHFAHPAPSYWETGGDYRNRWLPNKIKTHGSSPRRSAPGHELHVCYLQDGD